MPLFVVEATRQRAACWSRYCRFVGAPSLAGTPLVKTLVELGTQLSSRPVLILTSDECVDAISAARTEIEPVHRISLPAVETVQALADKSKFQLLAEREGFRVPRGLAVSNVNDCSQIGQLTAPLILKPADKTLVLAGMVERAVRADTIADAEQVARRILGQFVIIEPTVGRTDWQEESATLCGINLLLLTYRAEIGLPLAAPPSLAPGSPAWRSSWSFRPPLGSLHPKAKLVDGFLRWVDPLPALYPYAYETGVRRLWRRAEHGYRGLPLASKQEA